MTQTPSRNAALRVAQRAPRSVPQPASRPVATRSAKGLAAAGLLATLFLTAGCATKTGRLGAAPMVVRGHVVFGPEIPPAQQMSALQGAYVELRPIDRFGLSRPVAGLVGVVSPNGTFASPPTLPGRYMLALRGPALELSTTSVLVPPAPRARLDARRRADARAGGSLRLVGVGRGLVQLTRDEPKSAVPLRVDVMPKSREAVEINGLLGGAWAVDLPARGLTARIDVPEQGGAVTVPALPAVPVSAGRVRGRVIQVDGEPCQGAAVTVRIVDPETGQLSVWGRYAVTDRAGEYVVREVPPGDVWVAVERRERGFRYLPDSRQITIPPSGSVEVGFVVEP